MPSWRAETVRLGRVRLAVVLVIGSALAACSPSSAYSENNARLAVLRSSPSAAFVLHNSAVVSERTWPRCSADSRPSGMFERDFRVDGSVDRALKEATKVLVHDGWRVRLREGNGVWLDHPFPGWTASAELLAHDTSHLTISLAAPSNQRC